MVIELFLKQFYLHLLNYLTNEDKTTLETVLSPSVVTVLKKIAPELSPLLDQAKSNEENVTLPISVVRNYAIKIYGGDEKTAIQNFITDLSGGQPDNTNVPPDTVTQTQGMMAQDPNAEQDITPEMEAIDSGQELAQYQPTNYGSELPLSIRHSTKEEENGK